MEGRWPGFYILKSQGNAAATGPWTSTSKVLETPVAFNLILLKLPLMLLLIFQRGSRECANFKTDLLVLLLNLLNDAVEGYMIAEKGPRCLSINKSLWWTYLSLSSSFPRSAALLCGTISYWWKQCWSDQGMFQQCLSSALSIKVQCKVKPWLQNRLSHFWSNRSWALILLRQQPHSGS